MTNAAFFFLGALAVCPLWMLIVGRVLDAHLADLRSHAAFTEALLARLQDDEGLPS